MLPSTPSVRLLPLWPPPHPITPVPCPQELAADSVWVLAIPMSSWDNGKRDAFQAEALE